MVYPSDQDSVKTVYVSYIMCMYHTVWYTLLIKTVSRLCQTHPAGRDAETLGMTVRKQIGKSS